MQKDPSKQALRLLAMTPLETKDKKARMGAAINDWYIRKDKITNVLCNGRLSIEFDHLNLGTMGHVL